VIDDKQQAGMWWGKPHCADFFVLSSAVPGLVGLVVEREIGCRSSGGCVGRLLVSDVLELVHDDIALREVRDNA
jgi:hypothetical protein